MKELLDTDRVNFLIWRYLLECNYRETAAKFQKEWRVPQPHRHFDFAAHVNTYALVSLLNKGLIYEDFQRRFAESQQKTLQQDAAAGTAEAPAPRGVFGPLKFEPEDRVDGVEEDEEDSEMEVEVDDIESNPRKRLAERQHHHDELVSHGSPAKRQRLSNGYENGADSGAAPMEIDQRPDTTNHHAYPSPLEGEQAESPLLRTEGPSRGTQVEKAHDLTQNTVFLQLGAADGAADHEAAAESPLVLLCEWNPRDPLVLATAGTDALARIWTLPYREASPSDAQSNSADPSHVDGITNRPAISIVDDDLPKNATISAMAWSSNGELIAVAADLGLKSRVSIYSVEGTSLHRVDGLDSPVTNLCWSPNGSLLLSICPDVSKGLASPGTLIHISSPSLANSMSHHLAHDLRTDTLDTTWISETEFILCGGDLLVSFRCTENGIVQGREFKTGKDERFTLVEFDWRSKLVATASEKGFIDIWDEAGNRRTIPAHDGAVASLKWQPLLGDADCHQERLLVSGGEDGNIRIWNVLNADNTAKATITMPPRLAVNSLSLSPDGSFIAVATHDRVLVWRMGEHAIPKASWVPQPGWQSPSSTSDSEDVVPCLGWDAEGRRLVFGMENKLAVVDLREVEHDG